MTTRYPDDEILAHLKAPHSALTEKLAYILGDLKCTDPMEEVTSKSAAAAIVKIENLLKELGYEPRV